MKNIITSVICNLTFTTDKEKKIKVSLSCPSDDAPDVKALLTKIVEQVNDECGTSYEIRLNVKKTLAELGYPQ